MADMTIVSFLQKASSLATSDPGPKKPKVKVVGLSENTVSAGDVFGAAASGALKGALKGALGPIATFFGGGCGGAATGSNYGGDQVSEADGLDALLADADGQTAMDTSHSDAEMKTKDDHVSPDAEAVNIHDKDNDGYIDVEYSDVGLCEVYDPTKDQAGKELCDCNDWDPFINPGAKEVPCDGIDQNCDGKDLEDKDKDGYGGCAHSFPHDCDDANPLINPGALEIFCNDIDENCDGKPTICDPCDSEGETKPYYTGSEETKNVGECKEGVLVCEGGLFIISQYEVLPQPEKCNNKDDNCDGVIEEEWQKTYGGEGDETAFSVQQTQDGGFIMVGSKGAVEGDVYSGSEKCVAWLIKTDKYGNKEWEKVFEKGGDKNYLGSVKQTTDGGYILAGAVDSSGGKDAWLIKTDNFGNEKWSNTFKGGPNYLNNHFNSVQQTKDGGYITTGCMGALSCFNLLKVDSFGNKQWYQPYKKISTNAEEGYSVQETSDGGFIVVGNRYTEGSQMATWLIHTDNYGDEEWDKTLVGYGFAYPRVVQQTNDGGYIIIGDSGGSPISFPYLIKTDISGNELWGKSFMEVHGYGAKYSGQQTKEGGYIVAGSINPYFSNLSPSDTGEDFWLMKTDSFGIKKWDKIFGGNENEDARSVQQTDDGGYVIAGGTYSFGAGSSDVWIVKTCPPPQE